MNVKADLDNGYLKIANALFDSIALCDSLTKRDYRFLFYIIRHSYGYNRKFSPYNRNHIASCLSYKPVEISRTKKRLVEKRIIFEEDFGVSINTNCHEWEGFCGLFNAMQGVKNDTNNVKNNINNVKNDTEQMQQKTQECQKSHYLVSKMTPHCALTPHPEPLAEDTKDNKDNIYNTTLLDNGTNHVESVSPQLGNIMARLKTKLKPGEFAATDSPEQNRNKINIKNPKVKVDLSKKIPIEVFKRYKQISEKYAEELYKVKKSKGYTWDRSDFDALIDENGRKILDNAFGGYSYFCQFCEKQYSISPDGVVSAASNKIFNSLKQAYLAKEGEKRGVDDKPESIQANKTGSGLIAGCA